MNDAHGKPAYGAPTGEHACDLRSQADAAKWLRAERGQCDRDGTVDPAASPAEQGIPWVELEGFEPSTSCMPLMIGPLRRVGQILETPRIH